MLDYKDYENFINYLEKSEIITLYKASIINITAKSSRILSSESGAKLIKNLDGQLCELYNGNISDMGIEKWLIDSGCKYNKNNSIENRFITEFTDGEIMYDEMFQYVCDKFTKVCSDYKDFYINKMEGKYQSYEELIISGNGEVEYRLNRYLVCKFVLKSNVYKRKNTIILNVTKDTDEDILDKEIRSELEKMVYKMRLPKLNLYKVIKSFGENLQCISSPIFTGRLIHSSMKHFIEKSMMSSIGSRVCRKEVTIVDYANGDNIPNNYYIGEDSNHCRNITIIKDGILHGDLYEKGEESLKEYKIRNISLLPSKEDTNDMLKEIREGFYLDKYEDMHRDDVGNLFIKAREVIVIKDYKAIGVISEMNFTSDSFRFLKSISKVGSDFKWNNGILSYGAPTVVCKLNISIVQDS